MALSMVVLLAAMILDVRDTWEVPETAPGMQVPGAMIASPKDDANAKRLAISQASSTRRLAALELSPVSPILGTELFVRRRHECDPI